VSITNGPEPLSAEEQPAVGERVEIVYSNAVVVHQQLLAGCVVSASAFEPYKSGLAVFSNATYHQTGCTTALTGTSSALQLLEWWGYDTKTQVQKGAPVNNNSYGYLNKYTCANTNGTSYQNTLWQISGSEDWIVAPSPEIRLACGK
jgi:hypothetical protein